MERTMTKGDRHLITSTDHSQDDLTLYQRFRQCTSLFVRIFISQDSVDKETKGFRIQELTNDLLGLWSNIELASLFSSNEDLDDLSTRSLIFITVPAMLSECYHNYTTSPSNPDRRLYRFNDLNKSKEFVNTFTTLTQQYGINLSDHSAQILKDPRQEKIWRYKEEKRLSELFSVWASSNTDDDETLRENALQWVSMFQLRLADLSKSLDQEIIFLQSEKPEPQEQPQQIPLRPFVLTPKTIDSVFKPHYRLPTMTVDEYLQNEMGINKILSKSPGQQKLRDNDDEDDQAYKQRQWDEFKEAHPRGSGNRSRQS